MQLPTPVFLPEEFHGQRRLVGYSPWCCKESDVTERLTHTRKSDDIELYCHEKIAYSSVEKTGGKRACLV